MIKTLLITILFSFLFSFCNAETIEGKTGDAIYELDLDKSELRIKGKGYSGDYELYGAPWYSYRHKITKIIVEEGITNVPSHGFEVMSQLRSVELPSTIEKIGEYAFWACIRVENITINGFNNLVLGNNAFASCKSLLSIKFNADAIPDNCFEDCKKLKEFCFSNNCAKIGKAAFSFCESLEKISLNEQLKEIGDSSFFSCTKLDSISFPKSLKKIGKNTFENCYSLSNLVLYDSLSYIGDEAFRFCEGLKIVDLEHTKIDTLKIEVFDGCIALQKVNLPLNLKVAKLYCFRNCKSLEEIVVPSQTKYLEEGVFYQCEKLKTVVLPDSLEVIGMECFKSCKELEEFVIPLGIKLLGYNFLEVTPKLKKLYHLSPELHNVRYDDINSILPQRVTLYVKKGNKKKVSSTKWNHFTMVEEVK